MTDPLGPGGDVGFTDAALVCLALGGLIAIGALGEGDPSGLIAWIAGAVVLGLMGFVARVRARKEGEADD